MQNICGVDISKDGLDSFVGLDHFERFENSPECISALADFVLKHANTALAQGPQHHKHAAGSQFVNN